MGDLVVLHPSSVSSGFTRAVRAREDIRVSAPDHGFDALFIEHFDSIVRSLTAMTGDRERAVDATQEAFIKAYARWSKVRRLDLPAAWVRRVAINASRDSKRSDRRRAHREQANVDLAPPPPPDVDGLDAAVRLLATLPRRQREVAALYYLADCSVAEIASTLGVSEGTVKSNLADARERLRSRVSRNESSHD